MTPPFEFSEPRRSFVKKTLATSVSISFAGLIRAHGEEGGGTTWNADNATATTVPSEGTTTWNADNTSATSVPSEGTTTYNPDETTVPETTLEETSTAPKYQYAFKCIAVPTDLPCPPIFTGAVEVTQMSTNMWRVRGETPYNPDGPRDSGWVGFHIMASGPTKGEISNTMQCSASFTMYVQEEEVFSPAPVNIGGTQTSDSCVICIDPDTGLVTVQPGNPMQKEGPDNGDFRAYGMVAPAFGVYGMAKYHEDSFLWGETTIEVPLPGGLSFSTTSEAETFSVGPLQLDWTIIVVKRLLPGGEWETAPDEQQPSWIGTYNQ